MEELQLKKLILDTVTDKAGRFNYNDAYQISWNVGCTFELIKNILDSFIEKGVIKKIYYNPYENTTADVPIGEDSYEIFILKDKSININKLMK